MKFKKIRLDESRLEDFDSDSIFKDDDAITWVDAEFVPGYQMPGPSKTSATFNYDDDFSDPDYLPFSGSDHNTFSLEGPQPGNDTGVASVLIQAINDEWSTINSYNSIIATLKGIDAVTYEGMITVINEIISEEHRHIGQLQEILKQISPNTEEIAKGEKEGEEQLRFVDGKLPVQSMEPLTRNTSSDNPNVIDEICTICDIDDEM